MTRRRAPLALALAALGLLAAVGAIASTDRREAAAPAALPVAPSSRPPVALARRDGAVTVARRYALAARNWTAHSYPSSWRAQLALATGPYRRGLRAARPTWAQLRVLRADRASNLAVVTRAARDPRVRDPRARVLVWLEERTTAGGQVLAGTTGNEVRLRRRHGGWRVTGWTAVPGNRDGGSG